VWWQMYPRESRWPREAGPGDAPDPRLAPGTKVRLRGRPERVRKVLSSEWHRHRHRFVYIVETSGSFAAYWFPEQLVLEPDP
jgi:hypothetical protein